MLAKFVLEQQILECWNIVEDLKLTARALADERLEAQDAAKLLEGMATMCQLRFERTFNTFETVCKECQTAERAQALDP